MTLVLGLIIVLGSPNSETGELYTVAKERCAVVLAEYVQRPNWRFLLTGGYGAHFNTTDQPHAAYSKQYLLQQGVPSQALVEFAESTNTIQDAVLSKPIVLKYKVSEIVVVTSDYHIARARYIFEREFADTGISLAFLASQTQEAVWGFDLAAQERHEQQTLMKLRSES